MERKRQGTENREKRKGDRRGRNRKDVDAEVAFLPYLYNITTWFSFLKISFVYLPERQIYRERE